ncbi:MAG: sulfurtransferase [Desulfobacteraceae bacterium]|nr:sulfurtransferase [Desulfobacteraceae bacterium]
MSIGELSSKQLKLYIGQHHEKEFVLVDVRQPEEYQNGHIPGALLKPLPELVQTLDSLPNDKELVFYCHSGGRSSAAATMMEEEDLTNRNIYNLQGGIMAWDGHMAPDFPSICVFEGQSTVQMLKTAMNLEKGAQRFYTHVREIYGLEDWSDVFAQLAMAEMAHAKAVYRFWKKEIQDDIEPFDSLYKTITGDILEGGISMQEALTMLMPTNTHSGMRILETALKIEVSAFDLYRSLANQLPDKAASQTFMTIAQAEKGHMRELINAISKCPA